ncbi:hypothetical protein CABS01_00936 [Colletotrichum abscissum]|nr:uncharacterized protein CABS01_00936 [Colletotrichum abscissum]KAK1505468.1 hypothetical protein CABS01_00936 [Colletotrichum abscissum]
MTKNRKGKSKAKASSRDSSSQSGPSIPPRTTSSAESAINIPKRTGSVKGTDSSSKPVFGVMVGSNLVPERSSSKRKASWDVETLSSMSKVDLLKELKSNISKEEAQRKRLKPSTSHDSQFWKDCANHEGLKAYRVGVEAHLEFLDSKAKGRTKDWGEWIDSQNGQTFEVRHLAHQQRIGLLSKQAESMRADSLNTRIRDKLVELFVSSKLGLDATSAGIGSRRSTDQQKFKKKMLNAYCPKSLRPSRDSVWEPVLHKWVETPLCKAAHLYPWSQLHSMDLIFGSEGPRDIFSPKNGLILHTKIEWALDHGVIAIVPDVDLDPKNPDFPLEDQEEREERLRNWENGNVKDYKVIVVDKDHERAKELQNLGGDFITLNDLHGRKLEFLNGFRPRARYIWWQFYSSITKASWKMKALGQEDRDLMQKEILKATRFWGSPGPYVTEGILSSFAKTIGHSVESLHDSMAGKGDTEADDAALAALTAQATEGDYKLIKLLETSNPDGEDFEYSEGEEEEEDELHYKGDSDYDGDGDGDLN